MYRRNRGCILGCIFPRLLKNVQLSNGFNDKFLYFLDRVVKRKNSHSKVRTSPSSIDSLIFHPDTIIPSFRHAHSNVDRIGSKRSGHDRPSYTLLISSFDATALESLEYRPECENLAEPIFSNRVRSEANLFSPFP